jgi:hypothetical protein
MRDLDTGGDLAERLLLVTCLQHSNGEQNLSTLVSKKDANYGFSGSSSVLLH